MSIFSDPFKLDEVTEIDVPEVVNDLVDPPSPVPAASIPETSETQMSKDDGTRRPNVILSGNRLNDALPEGQTNIGNIGIAMPDPETQAKGFYLDAESAASLVAQFRQYKFLVNKGQATPPVRIGE